MSTIDPERRKRRHRNERIVATLLVLAVGLGTMLTIRWNQTAKEAIARDRKYIPRPVTMTSEVLLLQELVRIDSSHPEGIAEAARWIARYLEDNGIEAELIESSPSMINVYARIKGRSPGEGLLLFSHLDVVPAAEGWSRPPFDATLFGDQLFGRGTLDMKGMILCQLAAFVDIAKRKRPPPHDLVFLATADEESGSRWGMQWLLEHRPDIFENVAYGITEGGVTEIMKEEMTYFGIEIGGKAQIHVSVIAPSREMLGEARKTLEPHIFSRQPGRVVPEVARYLASLAPTRLQFRPLIEDIDATIKAGDFWRLPATYRDLLQNSLVTGPREPQGDAWQMMVTMLNLPDEDPEARLAWLERQVRPSGARLGVVHTKEGPVTFSRADTEVFRLLAEEARDRYKVTAGEQVLYRSATDARFLRPRGIQCYGISPYAVTIFQSATIHGTDEQIGVGAFQEGVQYLRNVAGKWAGE